MWKKLPLVLLFLSGIASAQSVLQAGPQAPGHAPMYGLIPQSQTIIQDSGPAAGGAVGTGLNELGLTVRGKGTPPYIAGGTGPFGSNLCDYDAPTNNPTGYHYICLSPNSNGGMSIIAGRGGIAAQLPLQFIINGVVTPINSPGNFNFIVTTVANLSVVLPTPIVGQAAYVTDAVSCVFGAGLTGGSTTGCPVHYNGSIWTGG